MVGQSLANGLRSTDYPIRWGGEEFLAILPGATDEGLEISAERLRMLVEHSWIQAGEQQIRVTISAGIAMARPDETFDELLDRADRLMYVSKKAGRNLVSDDSGPLPRRGQAPILGTGLPWETASPDLTHTPEQDRVAD